MPVHDQDAIRALIESQFSALRWDEDNHADWTTFGQGFLAGAQVVPAARPVDLQPVEAFVGRMRRLSENGELRRFSERPLAIEIRLYGNIATAFASCEMTENGDAVTRDVSAFLLVRSEGRWHIAAQAWDAETPSNPLPPELSAPAAKLPLP